MGCGAVRMRKTKKVKTWNRTVNKDGRGRGDRNRQGGEREDMNTERSWRKWLR